MMIRHITFGRQFILSGAATAMLMLFSFSGAVAQDYTFVVSIGTYGTGNGNFNTQTGCAVDFNGDIYVADGANHRIQVFNAAGTYLRQFGTWGNEAGKLNFPRCIAIGDDGKLYVGDVNGLQIFTNDGTFIQRVSGGTPVYDLVIDKKGTGNAFLLHSTSVSIYNASWGWVGTFGSIGSNNGQLSSATGIALGKDGYLYIADGGNHRVQVFATHGGYLGKFGSEGTEDGKFKNPSDVVLDDSGYIYVSESGSPRVQIFRRQGEVFEMVRKFGSWGTSQGQFRTPGSICLDGKGKIFVSDYSNSNVQVFSKEANSILNFNDLSKTFGDADFKLTATSEAAGYTPTYTEMPANTGDVTIEQRDDGYYVKIVRAGTVVIRAIVPENVKYGLASKDIVLTIAKANQTITFDALPDAIIGQTAPYVLTATTSSGLAVSFETDNQNAVTINEEGVVDLLEPATVTITARQSGDLNYHAADPVSRTLVIALVTDADGAEQDETRIFPIPANDVMTIQTTEDPLNYQFSIVNTQGKPMQNFSVVRIDDHTCQIHLPELAPGLYFLKMGGAMDRTYRIVKK
jgi:hypothetical protein